MIPIFCILYDKDIKRVNHVNQHLRPYLKKITLFSAIDGKTNQLEYHLENKKISTNFKKCRRGQLACLLSHLEVWKYMIDNDIPELIILEDDSVVHKDFYNKLEKIYDELPPDYEFLYLFVHDKSKNKIKSNKYNYIHKGFTTFGTVAYLITLNFVKKILPFFDTITTTIDDMLIKYFSKHKVNYYCVKENLVNTSGKMYFDSRKKSKLGSIISGTGYFSTSKPDPTFYIQEGDYKYYPCCDSPGNGISTNITNIKNLMENCLHDKNSLGFNTKGIVKYEIKTKNCWNVYRGSGGLYIKNKDIKSVINKRNMNIPVTCITYKKNPKRLQNVIHNLKPKFKDFRIFPAIDGKTNQLEYYLGSKLINENILSFCRRGQLACLLSHLEVWKNMIEEDIPEMIVIEDDCIIGDDFNEKFQLAYNELPDDYDILYLFSHPETRKLYRKDSSNYKYIDEGYQTYGFVGFLITVNLAKELLSLFKDHIINMVDDMTMHYLYTQKKRYFCTKENLVETGGKMFFHNKDETEFGSMIGETGIYKTSKARPEFYIEEENYLFYPCCDSAGGDLCQKSADIDDLKEEYLDEQKTVHLDEDVKAINGGGWIKTSLKKKNEWDVYKKGNFEGMWVKKSCREFYESVKPAILLTGGCGFIGSHTAVELLMKGYELIIVDDLSNSDYTVLENIKDIVRMEGLDPKIFFYSYDITNIYDLENVFLNHRNIKAVVHFAGYKAVGESVTEPLKYYHNNLVGLMNVIDCMKNFGVKNIIFSSSATVYGDPESLPLTEESTTSTLNPYGRTKLFCEEILKDASNAYDINTIILRYFNPVGAHKSGLIGESPKGIPNNLFPYILSVVKGERDHLNVFGDDYPTRDGSGVRDYIHVVDLAQGHVSALKYVIESQTDYEVFNLGTGNGYSVLEILDKFSEVGTEIPYKITERRAGDSAEIYSECSKAEKVLGWKASLTLTDMVKDVLNFVSKN